MQLLVHFYIIIDLFVNEAIFNLPGISVNRIVSSFKKTKLQASSRLSRTVSYLYAENE